MLEELRWIGQFLWLVATNWIFLVGGALMTIFGIVERLRGQEVHARIYLRILVCLLFVAFYLSWRDAKIQISQANLAVAPQKFDVADYEGREKSQKEISALKTENTETKKQLTRAQQELVETKSRLQALDPLRRPITTMTATAVVDVVTDYAPRANMGLGGAVAIGLRDRCLLGASTINHEMWPLPKGRRFRIVCNDLLDSDSIGKPVESLRDADIIQVIFHKDVIKPETEVIGGSVVIVINNQTMLTFQIPTQRTVVTGDNTSLFIRDIHDGIEPLLTQPSPTPDKAASPH